MDKSGGVHGGKGPAEVETDESGLVGRERSLARQTFIERPTAQEVRPYPDATVMDVNPVHGEDVGVADEGETAGFIEEAACGRFLVASRCFFVPSPGAVVACVYVLAKLERHLALKPGVEGTVDLAKAPGADAFDDLEWTPQSRTGGSWAWWRHAGATGIAAAHRAENLRDRLDEPQCLDA
jgi:hypothetical protein